MDATRSLLEASRRLNSTLDADELCRILSRTAARLVTAESALAGLKLDDELRVCAAVFQGRDRPGDPRYEPGGALAGQLKECRRAVVDNEAGRRHVYRLLEVYTAAAVPLCDSEDRVIGFFEVHNKEGGFQDQDLEILQAVGDMASTAIQNALAFERLKRSEAEVREANEQLEAFSYSMAHDLRAPLRGCASFAEVALARYGNKLDEEGRRYLERIRAASVKAGRLVDDILSLARVSREPMHRRRINLSNIVEELARDLRRADPSRKIEVRVQPDVWAGCDARLLAVALRQLLHNAWKFTVIRPAAIIEFGEKDRVFYVRDNGVGFKQIHAGSIFGPFHRLTLESGGTGIGLALVERIIQRHQGRVWAEGAEGRGATFFFTLAAK